MKRISKKLWAILLTGSIVMQFLLWISAQPLSAKAANVSETYQIPAAKSDGRVGASVPYTRYDSTYASLGGNASLATSLDFSKNNIASQASEQSYVRLPQNGAYTEWTMQSTGAGVTMRFTMPDSADGKGLNGSLDVYVNGNKVKTLDLTSYFMWQYFSSGNPTDINDGGTPCFAFDEVHFLLDSPLKAGDKLRIQSSGDGGYEYGVDFLEVEEVAAIIDQPDNSVNIEDFGAVANDGIDDYSAIYSAIAYADNHNMDVYFPAGTFSIGEVWRLYGSDMKITGAGMWYTNIQFTNPNAGGGGISGGWQTSGSKDGYCKNIEFCNMYINSSLSSRYNQQAVYKCFMDVFSSGSVIHDVWEEHFECGFWIGDYNGTMDYSDDLKIFNCRIRNNLADGVNFCQGTSHAAVYNCSIRNNGDDGLAMWNNSYGNAKDETGNIFAYNTIDFIWRAGAIAIYGGSGHQIYNNYICDTFMAAGIHLNTTFDGYKFTNNTGITFDNNVLVRCGSSSDSWNEELGALDIKQAVNNVTFRNTSIYDSQHEGVRILDNACSNILFESTKILGAGIDGKQANYSSVPHEGAAIRSGSEEAKFDGLQIANIAWKGENTPYFLTGGVHPTFQNVTIYEDGTAYNIPSYPTPNNSSQGGGVTDPLDGIEGYDLQVVGLNWHNEQNSTAICSGEKIGFTAAIRNTSNVDIPKGVVIGLKITVDDTGNYVHSTYKDGLSAGATIALSPSLSWSAQKGGHTILATVDYQNKLPKELDESNNTKSKKINVKNSGISTAYTPVTGGYDLYVTDITSNLDTIKENDNVIFSAHVVNAGDKSIPSGRVIGVQFQVDGNTSIITWSDTFNTGLAPGAIATLTANGGTNGKIWNAGNGTHIITAWVDDVDRLKNEVNENNNQTSVSFSIPQSETIYFTTPDGADNLTDLNHIYTMDSDWTGNDPDPTDPTVPNDPEPSLDYTPVTGGYDLYVTNISTSPATIKTNDSTKFTAKIVNAGDQAIPAGTIIGVQFQIDGNTSVITWSDTYNQGLEPGAYIDLTATGGTIGNSWTATSGTHTLTAWVDDVDRLTNEVNENNNKTSRSFTIP